MLAGELYRPGDAEISADQAANKAWLVRCLLPSAMRCWPNVSDTSAWAR